MTQSNQTAGTQGVAALVQQIDAIREQLESNGHEHVKNFVEAIDAADDLATQSEKQLDEVLADMEMLDSDTPPTE